MIISKSITSGRTSFYLTLVLLLAAVIHFRWISFAVFQYGDWRFRFAEVEKSFLKISAWDANFSRGQASYSLWKLPFDVIYGIFGYLGLDSNISDKFLVLWPAILLPPLASFFLARDIFRSNAAAFVGSLVYSFNSYFLSINTEGHEFLTVSAALSVLGLRAYIRAILQRDTSSYLATILFGCLSLIYDLRMAYVGAGIVFIYWAFQMASSKLRMEDKKDAAIRMATLVGIFLFLNSYWLLPEMASRSLATNEILGRGLFGNEFFNLARAVTLFHPFWNGAKPVWFQVQPTPWYLFFIPVLAFFGLLLNRKNGVVLFFGVLSVVGIFLTKQSSEPFPHVYEFLFRHVPGFSAFREASKFYFVIAISYSVLIAGLASWLQEKFARKGISRLARYLLTVFVLCLFGWNAIPMITGVIETMFVPRRVPEDYVRLKRHVLSDQEYSRVLWVPVDAPWEIYNERHPTLSMGEIAFAGWDLMISPVGTGSYETPRDSIEEFFSRSHARRLLQDSSVRYLVLPLRDKLNDDDMYVYYGARSFYSGELDRLSDVRKLDLGMANAVIYENRNYKPHIYLTNEPGTIRRDVAYQRIGFDARNASEYRLTIKDLASPMYLNFSDNYNSGWHIYIGPFNWIGAMVGQSPMKGEGFHTKSDAGLNSFYIDPGYISKNFPKSSFKQNNHGSIDVDVTLYFTAQGYAYLGLMISLLALAGCIAYTLKSRFAGAGEKGQTAQKVVLI